MRNQRGKLCSAAFAAALACMAGCATVKQENKVAANSPDWVTKGSGAFKDAAGGTVFYGVGMSQGVRNRALAVEAADASARGAIAKTMNALVANLLKRYMASTTAGDLGKSSEEQHTQSTLREFAQYTLNGASIIDHWRDPSDGTMFALCKLDMTAVKKTLENSKELDEKVRDYVRANADKASDELQAGLGNQ